MTERASATAVQALMTEFADLTGLTSAKPPKRYLWTDAFAVCNLLELERQTSEAGFQELALRMVDQVHHILGQHRQDDPRRGWISGLDDQAGEEHPTAGGLRIGKQLNERQPHDPLDDRSEWDRDGQYYHYLTKWMHALQRMSQATGDARYHRWAVELARTAHARFTYRPTPGGELRMHWKMSVDLSHPLVPSQGHHDPLDGWITYQQLQADVPEDAPHGLRLDVEIEDLARVCAGMSWVTDDPLGIGGLLSDVCRAAALVAEGKFAEPRLPRQLLHSARIGLEAYLRTEPLRRPLAYRLAFRELGLSIGLRGVQRLQSFTESGVSIGSDVEELTQYLPLAEQIESFWLQPTHQASESWLAHREINMVMLATSLAPDGYLFDRSVRRPKDGEVSTPPT